MRYLALASDFDQAFLDICGAAIAVANALPTLKAQADWVTQGSRGSGVEELIKQMLDSDLAQVLKQQP